VDPEGLGSKGSFQVRANVIRLILNKKSRTTKTGGVKEKEFFWLRLSRLGQGEEKETKKGLTHSITNPEKKIYQSLTEV